MLTSELTKFERPADVPAEACRFGGGTVKFADAAANGNVPIEMVARSNDPVDHWWWGRIVHDFAGMKVHKSVLTCDYEHYDPIGFLDKREVGDEGLTVSGELVPTDVAGDVTTRIIQLSRGGVPFEASIYFDESDLLLEYVPDGFSSPVNGGTFEGPGVIAREWYLRGVAVCSYGYDKSTQSKFCREAGNKNNRFSLFQEPAMAKPITKLSDATPAADPATPAVTTEPADTTTETPAAEPKATEQPEATDAPAPADATAAALSAMREEIKRFRTAFGEKGPVYFDDGLTFAEATARHVKELSDSVAALTAQNKDLASKLSKATGQPAGELTPVDFQAADDQKKKSGFASRIRVPGAARAS